MSKLEKKLTALWNRREDGPYRYVPKWTGSGQEWGVFDRRKAEFIEPDHVVKIRTDDLVFEKWAN